MSTGTGAGPSSAAVTIVVHDAANVIAGAVGRVLADWHGCGWVSGLLLVSAQEIAAHGQDIGNVVAHQPAGPTDPPAKVRLRDVDLDGPLRIVVLDPVGADASWVTRRQWLHGTASQLNTALLAHRSAAVDLIIAWHGGYWEPDLAIWPGWDTLVAAPEDSDALSTPGLPLFADLANPEQVLDLAGHAAAFTASVAGLWSGANGAPLDRATGADEVRMGRALHRRMDASAVADLLRASCLDPKLTRDTRALHAVGTEELTRRARAAREQVNLAPTPKSPGRPAPKVVAMGEALRMFFSFMFGALLRAPKEIAAGFVHHGRAKLSRELGRRLFGPDSAVVVSVGGVIGSGTGARAADGAAAARDQEAALDELWGNLAAVPGLTLPDPGTGVSQRGLWSYVVDQCLTLVTGSAQPSVEPYMVDGRPRYFDAEQVAPAIVGHWNASSGLLEGVPAAGIQCNDIASVRRARRQLAAIAADDSSTWRVGAEASRAELDAAAAPWEASFLGQVGGMIFDGYEHFSKRIAELVEIASRPDDTAGAEAEKIAMDMGRFAKIATLVAVILAAVVGVAGLLFLPGKWVAGLLGAIIVGWVVALLVKYWRNYRRLFELRHRAEVADYELARVRVELPSVVENARRLARIYSQYLFWSATLSAFLREPFGRAQPRQEQLLGMTGAVPRSVSCGVYLSDDPRATQTANRIADSLRPNLPALWSQFLAAGRELLVAREPAREPVQVADILAETEIGPDSYLAAWLAVSLEDSPKSGVRSSAPLAQQVDAAQMQRIITAMPEGALAALRQQFAVRRVGAGAAPSATRIQPGAQALADFEPHAFSSFGLHEGYPQVDPRTAFYQSSATIVQRETRHWLDEVDTAVVFSQPLLPQGLALLPPVAGGPDTGESESEAANLTGLQL